MGDGWEAVSPRLRALRRWEVAAVAVVLVAVAVVVGLVTGGAVAGAIAAGAVVVCAAVADGVLGRRFRSWAYAERDEDLLVRRGVMFRRLSVIPYGRMQYIDVTAGPAERIFGLATVKMHTAAAASDARIPGLPKAEADRLRQQLTTLGQSQAAGL